MTTTKEMNTLSFDGGSTLYTITDTTSRSNIGTLSSLNTVDKTNLVAAINEVLSTVSSVYKFKGSVANYAALPITAEVGDVYNVEDTGANYAYTEDGWDKLSETIDLSGYQTLLSSTNKLNADFIQDGTTNKTVTATEKSTWNGKQNANTAVTHTASTAVGSDIQPVYIASDGTATTTSFSLAKSVPADAVFTDTTYSAMTGASASEAGISGLVPAPASGDNTKFLQGDGTWATPENTTYTEGIGIDITNGVISNDGVRSISQGSNNGTISVNTGGTSAEVSVKGLGTSAFVDTTSSVTSADTKTLTSGGAYTNLVRRLSSSSATGSASQGVYVDTNGQVQVCDAVTSTYNSSGTAPVNGTAVASAITNLVPNTRTINGKALSSNISLSASDVSALPSSTVIPTITDTYSGTSSDGMSGKAVASAINNYAEDNIGDLSDLETSSQINVVSAINELKANINMPISYSVTNPTLTPTDGICTWVITHNLNSSNIFSVTYDNNNNEISKNTTINNSNQITISFTSSDTVTANSYKTVVTKGGIGTGSSNDINELIITGSNLYNKNTITPGYYVHNANGNLTAAEGYNASDWIVVKPSTTYTKRTTSTFAMYDANRVYISGGSGTRTITTTSNTKYVRISVENNIKDVNTLVEGTSQSYDTAYYNQFLYSNPDDNLFHDIRGTYQTVHKIEAGTYVGKVDQIDHYRSSDNVKVRSDVFTYAENLITEVRTLDATNTKLTYIYHTDTEITEVI